MKLHWSPKSPYVRKVMIAAHELGAAADILTVRSVATMRELNPVIMADNPLGKIPTLTTEEGVSLFDSRVICEYLDARYGGTLFPATGDELWGALRWQALGDGLLDVLILWRNEREKPEVARTASWVTGFEAKLAKGLELLEAEAEELARSHFAIGHISIGCMLSYIDFRFDHLRWRASHPALARWHAEFAARDSARKTEIADD